jgi:23S rRNA (cytosine1962-C5)-methyltransferase
MKRLQLKEKEERRLLRGHLWVFRNELAEAPAFDDGAPVDVVASNGRFIGRGFYQAQGGIAARILARHQVEIDAAFWSRQLETARSLRERLFAGQTVYRWIFGESDGLPGFVADRYGAVVVAESSCAFYHECADQLAKTFLATDGVSGCVITVAGRRHEYGEVPESADCVLEGINMRVPLRGGQKTGLFLDQRVNSAATRAYASGARVLDAHCYSGIWSIHAALAGAREIRAIDTSQSAIEMARENAKRNGVDAACSFECADVMEVFKQGGYYDLVILDPPAFAKSRVQEKKALGLYQSLNKAAMDVVEPGGFLVTSTCSHFVNREAFLEVLKRAATSAQRQAVVLDVRGAAPDHPVLMAMPETEYLTCVWMRILGK